MLTQEHMSAYRNDGVVQIKNAFSQEWLDEVRSLIEFGRVRQFQNIPPGTVRLNRLA